MRRCEPVEKIQYDCTGFVDGARNLSKSAYAYRWNSGTQRAPEERETHVLDTQEFRKLAPYVEWVQLSTKRKKGG